jgi:SAM-dependent methyltransferase
MTHRCDLCDSGDWYELPQDRRIAVCGGCGFVFVPERRSSEEIADSWAEIYRKGLYDPTWPAVKARLFYVAEWIDQMIGLNGKSLLDIGAGKGQFLSFAAKYGASVFGIEPAAEEYDYRIVRRSIEAGPLTEKWDVVTINWTLENCGDCLAMLRFARDHCKPGGHVVVATGSRLLVPFKKPLSKYLNREIAADLHCFRWSANGLSRAGLLVDLAPEYVNPFEECDWLVTAFRHGNDGRIYTVHIDDPKEVLDFFDVWSEICP